MRHQVQRPDKALAQRGAILLAVLVMLALVAYASQGMLMDTSRQQQRANEEELLFVGEQYRQAIESYLRATPNGVRRYPASLEDLVADNRFPQPRRHLRKLFRDPMSPQTDWVLIKMGTSLIGVRSQSKGEPFRKAGFTSKQENFASAQAYSDWEFKVANALPPPQANGFVAPPNGNPNTPKPGPRPVVR